MDGRLGIMPHAGGGLPAAAWLAMLHSTPPQPTASAGSICAMKRNVHAIIPEEDFQCTQGSDALTLYTFNTGVAKHLFCNRCGICPFYRPRSNPKHYAGGVVHFSGGGEEGGGL